MFLNTHDLFDDEKKKTIQQFIDNIPLFIIVKDITSRYLMGNSHYAKMLGVSNSQTLVGMCAAECNVQIKKIAHLFMAEDVLVMKRNCVQVFRSKTHSTASNGPRRPTRIPPSLKSLDSSRPVPYTITLGGIDMGRNTVVVTERPITIPTSVL